MKRIDTKILKDQCADGIKNAEIAVGNAVQTCKDIIICPKFFSDFRIKSKSKDRDLFRVKMSVDKEISLFKLIIGVIAIFVAGAVICMALDSAFGCKNKNDKSEY